MSYDFLCDHPESVEEWEQREGTARKKAVTGRKATRSGLRVAVETQTPSGDAYACESRGRFVPVDEMCDCAQFCDVSCSGTPMRTGRAPVRAQGALARMVGDL